MADDPQDPQPEPQPPQPTPAENTSSVSRIIEGRPGNIEGDIDQRMANVLADHIEMGARPADDVTVAENRETTTAEDAPKPAKKAKKAGAKKSK